MNEAKHVAIIMDGNGRWAKLQGRPRTFGHIKGARVAKRIITQAVERKIDYLTLFAFSTENWSRPWAEVSFLMSLLQRYLRRELQTLKRQNVRFQIIGDLKRLPKEVQQVVQYTMDETSHNTGLVLTFALSYGSRQELVEAVKILAERAKAGEIQVEEINEELLSAHLYTQKMPDPDLIIRTSGEHRLSNFMLWQAAYSEFYFTERLWPDFTEDDFTDALNSFEQRERRFGRVSNHELPAH